MTQKQLLKKLDKIFSKGEYFVVYTEKNDMLRFGKIAKNEKIHASSTGHITLYLEISFGWWYMSDANKTPVYAINRPSFSFMHEFYSEDMGDDYYTKIQEISKEKFFEAYKKIEAAIAIRKDIYKEYESMFNKDEN